MHVVFILWQKQKQEHSEEHINSMNLIDTDDLWNFSSYLTITPAFVSVFF